MKTFMENPQKITNLFSAKEHKEWDSVNQPSETTTNQLEKSNKLQLMEVNLCESE